jgi:hypothetical protein
VKSQSRTKSLILPYSVFNLAIVDRINSRFSMTKKGTTDFSSSSCQLTLATPTIYSIILFPPRVSNLPYSTLQATVVGTVIGDKIVFILGAALTKADFDQGMKMDQ